MEFHGYEYYIVYCLDDFIELIKKINYKQKAKELK